MAWKRVLFLSLLSIALVESSSEAWKMLLLNPSADASSSPGWPILSAGVFVAVSLVLSFYLIFQHLGAYNQPEEQKFLIGLILMVPVYAVESYLSLLDSQVAFVCEMMRDCYEAFAMYCFERYLIACLGPHFAMTFAAVVPGVFYGSFIVQVHMNGYLTTPLTFGGFAPVV